MDQDTKATPSDEPRNEEGLLDVLQLLIETKKAKTTADLVRYASQYGAPEAEQRLRMLEAEGIPLGLAFEAVSVHLRILAHRRNSALLAGCKGKKVGLILPVPHHVVDLFSQVATVTLMQPGEHALHGPLQDLEASILRGIRACRAAAVDLEVLVFESFREDGVLHVDPAIGDVIEPKLLPSGITLLAHLRPHRNPGDVPYHSSAEIAFI